MTPLHRDPHFTFRFADNRLVPRFHLDGVEPGTPVSVFAIDPESGERLGLIATASVGDGGWVDLPEPLVVQAGRASLPFAEPQAVGTIATSTGADGVWFDILAFSRPNHLPPVDPARLALMLTCSPAVAAHCRRPTPN